MCLWKFITFCNTHLLNAVTSAIMQSANKYFEISISCWCFFGVAQHISCHIYMAARSYCMMHKMLQDDLCCLTCSSLLDFSFPVIPFRLQCWQFSEILSFLCKNWIAWNICRTIFCFCLRFILNFFILDPCTVVRKVVNCTEKLFGGQARTVFPLCAIIMLVVSFFSWVSCSYIEGYWPFCKVILICFSALITPL